MLRSCSLTFRLLVHPSCLEKTSSPISVRCEITTANSLKLVTCRGNRPSATMLSGLIVFAKTEKFASGLVTNSLRPRTSSVLILTSLSSKGGLALDPSPNLPRRYTDRTVSEPQSRTVAHRRQAGHYEILGETHAKLEFFENGWNPYSRFLDIDKIDLILRKTVDGSRVYREVQVKYGKLYQVGSAWERALFDVTSWRFFKEDEFGTHVGQKDFFVAYVLAAEAGYRGDIFIFPGSVFNHLIGCGISSKGKRKIYISHLLAGPDRWVLRRVNRFESVTEETCLDVSQYRRNFGALLESTAAAPVSQRLA